MRFCQIDIDVPCGKSGDWEVKEFVVSRHDAAMNNLGQWFNHDSRHITPGKYKALTCKGAVVMSNTPAEVADHMAFISRACGEVLINGLGLGMVLKAILKKPEVGRVTVVEISTDVIALAAPTYQKDRRVNIVHDDAFTYKIPKTADRIDCVWNDIWQHISSDNLPEMARLHRKYSRRCWWQDCWCRQECLRAKRKERAEEKCYALLRGKRDQQAVG